MADYYAIEAHKDKGEAMYENWRNYLKVNEPKKYKSQFLSQISIFDEKSGKKFVEYFVEWAEIFRALSI